MKKIVIIGGGITGLTAAYSLQKELINQDLPVEIELIEASEHLGGKIRTLRKDGFTIERGPDSFLIRKKSMERLVRDIGIGDKLVTNGTGQSYVLVGDKLHKIPHGSFMGIPLQVRPFLFSGLFSPLGKIRAGFDFVLPKSEVKEDQSLGHFFRRRLGDEMLENLIEPLLSGIYAGDMDDLSLMSTFPNFYEVEQKHGSLIRGLKRTVPKKKSQKKKPSMFYSIKGGLETVVEALEEKLTETSILKGIQVDHIEKKEAGYHVLLSNGEVSRADAIIMATPYYQTAKMLSQYDFVQELQKMKATSVANVALAFDQSAIKKDLDGTGFVISRNSDYRITACTWTHKKWPETAAPPGKALLRCYVGRPHDQEIVDLSDQELEEIVLKDLNKIMKIDAKPLFSVVTRWKKAMPQYSVGHKAMMDRIAESMAEELPGIYLAGASYRGLGLPDCIDQAEAATKEVLAHILEKE
ncbi:protoporphyrinogen oxidase [Saliterribacillus persicus]|uniref:Coproporphyrinogen III oxidase n=2 Tax=Saliterribacillus persicus TaxID=930114 RepID=A0A368XT36_9BACI|nr:protoporphyrinogen oxidase [Saliterribacillus persicus]